MAPKKDAREAQSPEPSERKERAARS